MDSTRSLQDLFFDVRAIYEASGREGVRLCAELSKAVDAAQLFSMNESAEEVATADLKFLLLPFYNAALLQRCDVRDPAAKAEILKEALGRYNAFLQRLWDYELCGQTAKGMFRDEESLLKGYSNGGVSREQKIARLKRERWIRTEIDRMRQIEVDEEHEREVWCLELEAAFLKALTERHLLLQEIEIVEFAAQRRADQQEHAESVDPKSKVSTVVQHLANNMQKREALKQQVFRPSHILPTMTVEQFAQVECQRALEHQQHTHSASGPEEQHDSDDDVYRQRAWDDWKDDHPRGCGNSKLKPCS